MQQRNANISLLNYLCLQNMNGFYKIQTRVVGEDNIARWWQPNVNRNEQ